MIKVFYTPKQSTYVASDSPSAFKPPQVFDDWRNHALRFGSGTVYPATREDFCTAHAEEYVDGVLDLTIPNGFGTKDLEVAETLPWTVGSIMSAAKHVALASTHGQVVAAASLTSGFHHAGYSFGGGFCTFNGLMIAAISVLYADTAVLPGILDLDYHYGNGTQNIIERLGYQKMIPHFSSGQTYTVPWDAQPLLDRIPKIIAAMATRGVKVILYQAGADMHLDDPFGGMMSTKQMRERDRIVFEQCKQAGIGVAWNLAGGYQKPLSRVIELHRNTMEECINVFD